MAACREADIPDTFVVSYIGTDETLELVSNNERESFGHYLESLLIRLIVEVE